MRVYHFTNADYAQKTLRNRRLKIAEFHDLNDPFELLGAELTESAHRQIFSSWKETIERKWGVLCFSRSWHNPVLWSHYSDKHRGICLGFDVADSFLKKIRYTGKRIKVDIVSVLNSRDVGESIVDRLLFTKYTDWRYEKESRAAVQLRHRDSSTGLYFYDFDNRVKLAEVIAGARSTLSEAAIRAWLAEDDRDVALTQSRLAFRSFRVVENKKGFKK